jgi:hypothetical protein
VFAGLAALYCESWLKEQPGQITRTAATHGPAAAPCLIGSVNMTPQTAADPGGVRHSQHVRSRLPTPETGNPGCCSQHRVVNTPLAGIVDIVDIVTIASSLCVWGCACPSGPAGCAIAASLPALVIPFPSDALISSAPTISPPARSPNLYWSYLRGVRALSDFAAA